MSNSRRASIDRCINSVIQRMNESTLTRRPLKRVDSSPKKSVKGKKRYHRFESGDDESDSDYLPSDSDNETGATEKSTKRRSARTALKARNSNSSSRSPPPKKAKLELPKKSLRGSQSSKKDSPPSTVPEENIWGIRAPLDVLHKVFQMALLNEPTIPFLTRMRKVCRLWNEAVQSPHLWSSVDLEYLKGKENHGVVFAALDQYSAGIRDLSFSRWSKLQTPVIAGLLTSTKELRSLNISFCEALDLRRLLCAIVPDCCQKLNSLDLSYIDPTGKKRMIAILREFLSMESGRRLTSLYLNGNLLADLRRLCTNSALNNATQNITVLDLSRCILRGGKVVLTDFVKAFPRLRVLHMADAMIHFTCTPDEEANFFDGAWPNLVECDISASRGWNRYDDGYDAFIKLLGHCKNLRRLDLSGLRIQDRLVWLRETPLTHLNLSRVRELAKNAVSMDQFSLWCHSLRTFRMTWVIGYVDALCALFVAAKKRGFAPELKRLDLTGTCVTAAQLRVLLDTCQSLEFVDVQSCRGMPLGMKKAYDGIDEIKALRLKLGNENFLVSA